MSAPAGKSPGPRFGDFEVDLQEAELRKSGIRIKLQEQPFHILTMLLERPGQTVTREELRQKLWPADTFVDFEHSLNSSIKKLREALGDHSENPRFIESLHRRGYRFIAPVETERRPEPVPAPPPPHRHRATTVAVVLGVAVLAAIAALFAFKVNGWRSRLSRHAESSPIQSLAVLPLANLSGDPQQDYFAEGMTDALITDLAKLHAVRVISRTSVMRFKDTKQPLAEVAQALDADGILEGSVQRSGGRIRITVQLIRAPSEDHVWAESYERDARDILALQAEVAQAVARAINIALTPEESSHLARASSRPVNTEAYEFYLKAQYHYYKWNPDDSRKAIEFFQQAIKADPHWAPPYAGLANSYGWLWIEGAMPPKEALPQFSAALKTALEIDPTLPEVHYTKAAAAFYYRWDWDEADREFQLALALDPSLVEARFEYAWFLSAMGRNAEAVAEAQRAVERDPLSVPANFALANIYLASHQDDRAIAQSQRVLQIDPSYADAYGLLSGSYEEKQMYGESIQNLQKAMSLWGASPAEIAGIARAYQETGAKGCLMWQLEEAKRRQVPFDIAMAYARLGDADQSVAWLEKSYQQHDWRMVQLRSGSPWDPIRSDPRFHDLLRRMKFPQ